MGKLFFIVLIFLIIAAPVYPEPAEIGQDKNGNLELHIVADEDVEIKVFIDDKLAVSEYFKKFTGPDLGIAPHKIFRFKLKPGKHTLQAKAEQGKYNFSGEFELADKRWIYLSYVGPDRLGQEQPFRMEIYDYQIMYE